MSGRIMGITGTGKPRSAKRGDVDVPRCVKGGRRRWRAGIAVPLMMAAAGAHAESWKFEPFVNLSETFTNNVLLQPNDTRKSDWVTELTPGARITEAGAHSSLIGLVSLPTLLYARTSSENQVVPNINLLGKLELIDHLLFIDGSIFVNQQYLTPFGARSDSLTNATDNRYTSQVYRISPFIKGSAGSDYSYELRDDNTWSKGSSSFVNDSYTNELTGSFRRDPRPFGWAFEFDRTSSKFQDQAEQLLELARLRGLYEFDPQLLLSLSGGYEHNDLLIETKSNIIYGGGLRWRPSDRTSLDANVEHRFFGTSYNFAFNHRTPLSVWSVVASRNITTYPEQLAALPGGVDVTAALNQLFLSRVTDPAARQALVNQVIADRGLPLYLTSPVTIYNQQVQLQESLVATAGFLGVRNTLFLTAFRLKVEPITGSGSVLPPVIEALTSNTQSGGNLVWSHSVTPSLTLTGSVDGSRTVQNTQPGVTKQATVRFGATTPLSALTSVFGGVRYQSSRSTITTDYEEAAVYVGFNHKFN